MTAKSRAARKRTTKARWRQTAKALAELTGEIVACRRCARLVEHRERIGEVKREVLRRLGLLGQARSQLRRPAGPADGAGPRSGSPRRQPDRASVYRGFVGDISHEELCTRPGSPTSPFPTTANDGLEYNGVYVCAAVRCVPPQDRPTPEEQRTCLPYLVREMQLLPNLCVVLALGQIAFQAALRALTEMAERSLRGKFSHGEVYRFEPELPLLVACYHPSPRNTNTGRLSMEQLVETLQKAKRLSEEELAAGTGRA